MEPELNQVIVLPVEGPATTLALASPLFLIESINTAEARIQSVSTPDGNEHTVQKFALESFVGIKIPTGSLALVASNPDNDQPRAILAVIELLDSQ